MAMCLKGHCGYKWKMGWREESVESEMFWGPPSI